MALTQKQYKLALEISANARRAKMAVNDLQKSVNMMNARANKTGNILARGFNRSITYASSLHARMRKIYSTSKKIVKPFVKGFSTAFGWLSKISSGLLKLPLKALKWGAIGAGAVAGGAYLADKALTPAAKIERYQEQFRVQGTPEMLPWLKTMALKTTNSLDELIQSTILMQNFKIDPKKYLTPMMDLSNMFNKPLEEIARSMGMLKSERYGEALESLARSGITRADLKALGIKFTKSGEVADGSKSKIFDKVIELMKRNYSGASERRALTYEGKKSMLGDAWFNSLAEGFKGLLPHAKKIVDGLTDYVNKVGKALKTIDWDGIGSRFVGYFEKAKVIGEKILTGQGREELWNRGERIVKNITELIPLIMTDITGSMGNILNEVGRWWDTVGGNKIVKAFIKGAKETVYMAAHGGKTRDEVKLESLTNKREGIIGYINQKREDSKPDWFERKLGINVSGRAKKNNEIIQEKYAEYDKLVAEEAKLRSRLAREDSYKIQWGGVKWSKKTQDKMGAIGKEFRGAATPTYYGELHQNMPYTNTRDMLYNYEHMRDVTAGIMKLGTSSGAWNTLAPTEPQTYSINDNHYFNSGAVNRRLSDLEGVVNQINNIGAGPRAEQNYSREITAPLLTKLNELISAVQEQIKHIEAGNQPIKVEIAGA